MVAKVQQQSEIGVCLSNTNDDDGDGDEVDGILLMFVLLVLQVHESF